MLMQEFAIISGTHRNDPENKGKTSSLTNSLYVGAVCHKTGL